MMADARTAGLGSDGAGSELAKLRTGQVVEHLGLERIGREEGHPLDDQADGREVA